MFWRERSSCYFKQIPSSHNAAAPLSVSVFHKKHESEFFTVVNPRQSLLRLIRKGVITEVVKSSIDASNTKDALDILYNHLKHYGSVNTLLEYCEMAIDADGFPNMQSFGRRMKVELQQGGWLVSVCVGGCGCVGGWVCLTTIQLQASVLFSVQLPYYLCPLLLPSPSRVLLHLPAQLRQPQSIPVVGTSGTCALAGLL